MVIRHLYVHIPFCHRICPYCAFYKHQPAETSTGAFADALLGELDLHKHRYDIVPQTIYFGGGTPSLLSETVLGALLDGLRQRLDLSELLEWSTEANPMTFDRSKAQLMRDHGIDRVSLGVQSWQTHLLKTLGRDHTPDQAQQSFEILTEVGFPVVNIDLMFSLPEQTLPQWEADLQRTLSLKPVHISAYNLTYEEDTPFFDQLGKGSYLDNEDNNADHFYRADALLTDAGFEHYEISNYAQPGARSQHNQAYWRSADYLSLGPSAVSTVTGQRWRNVPDTARYVAQIARGEGALRQEIETLSAADRHNERVAMTLRTRRGLASAALDETLHARAQDLIEEGLLLLEGAHYCVTADHRALVDPIAAELML